MQVDVVTGAAFRVAVQLEGRSYTLRPPTFGEAGELASVTVGTVRPGAAMVTEAVRQALEELLAGEEKAAELAKAMQAIAAHEDADDYVQAVLVTRPMDNEPPSAFAEWRGQLRDAQRDLLKADRARQLAEKIVADHPRVVEMRSATLRASFAERLATVRLCLVGWSGPGLPEWQVGEDGRVPEAVLNSMPAGELAALAERAGNLMRPAKAAEKN